MLTDHRMHATLPTADLERARAFWGDLLGFSVYREVEGGAIMFESHGSRFALFLTPNEVRGGHTQSGFEVDDIRAEVAWLTGNGVVFESYDYPMLQTDPSGIAKTAAGMSAWFKDPDNNLIGIVQFEK